MTSRSTPVAFLALLIIDSSALLSPSPSLAQLTPEFLGVYAVVDGKLLEMPRSPGVETSTALARRPAGGAATSSAGALEGRGLIARASPEFCVCVPLPDEKQCKR